MPVVKLSWHGVIVTTFDLVISCCNEVLSWRSEMSVVIIITVLFTLLYSVLMILYRLGWEKQSWCVLPAGFTPVTNISVIIPARNEEDNIGACIESILDQDYPKDLLEVIVVDDHSTDDTARVIKSYPEVKYINLAEHMPPDSKIAAYKKRALATGIDNSNGDLIITTDADCISREGWLKNIAALYEQKQPVMIVAPVDFTHDNSLVQVFQSLDFMTMQGITVAALQMRLGNMCNGANLAFSKNAYYEVDGYKGIDHIASGDDYLLMMKLKKQYPGQVDYLKSRAAIVSTPPQPDWKSFFRQRIRWASKSGKYDDSTLTFILGFVYLYNVMLFAATIYCVFNISQWKYLLLILILKTLFESLYLVPVARYFDKLKQLRVFPLLQPVHILYIVSAGLLGFFGVYTWKGRKVR